MPIADALQTVLSWIPPGRYAVAVSGGADSVALLHLVRRHRPEVRVHVVHLDHQTRGAASTGDATFVRALSGRLNMPCTIALRDGIEHSMPDLPANPSARYRRVRLELFRRIIREHGLEGVMLAHHADDQAETILHRLLRGSSFAGLGGMAQESRLAGIRMLRPLLTVRAIALRNFLRESHEPWREDASNASDDYFRNRLRRLLATNEDITAALLQLGEACRGLREWVRRAAPELPESFSAAALADLPAILASESARRWLLARGAAADHVTPPVIQRLIAMATDAAAPARQHFPGRLLVRRRNRRLFVDLSAPPHSA